MGAKRKKQLILTWVVGKALLKAAALRLALARGRFGVVEKAPEEFFSSGIQLKKKRKLYKVQDDLRDFKLLSAGEA